MTSCRFDSPDGVDALVDELVVEVVVDREDSQPLVRGNEKRLAYEPGWNHRDEHGGLVGLAVLEPEEEPTREREEFWREVERRRAYAGSDYGQNDSRDASLDGLDNDGGSM